MKSKSTFLGPLGGLRGLLGLMMSLLAMGLPACDSNDPAVLPEQGPGNNFAGEATARIDAGSDNSQVEDPADAMLAQTALRMLDSGRFEEAEALLRNEIDESDERSRLQFLLGIAMQKQKRYGPAIARLDAALASGRAFPERRHAAHFRGWCLFYLGRPEASAVAFRSHLEVMPDEADSHFGLGVALLETGEPEAALPAFESAIALNQAIPERRRDLAKALIRRGDAYWELDRIEDAQMSFQKGIVQFPDHYEGWAKLARAMDRLGDPVRAERARFEEQQARIRVGAPLGDPESDSELNSSKDLP